MSRDNVNLPLPAEFVEAVAERAAEILAERNGYGSDPWLGVTAAAEYLDCPKSRIYALVSARRIPHDRDGSRLIFKPSELDAWVRGGGAKRP